MAAAPKGTRGGASKIVRVDADAAAPAPVVLISGAEEFLAERAERRIRDALRELDPALEVHDVDGAGYLAGEIFTLASPSLFGEPRLIRIAGLEQATDALLSDLKRYLVEPAPDTTVLLRHAGGARGKAVLDAVRGETGAALGAVEVPCLPITRDSDRTAFAHAEFRRHGARITEGALRALVQAYGTGIAELASAIERLVADAGRSIDEEVVARATEGRIEAGAFRVADAATAGREADALVLLRHAFASGVDPIPLLAAINMKVRAMARTFGAPGSAAQLAKTFGMAPWQVERAMKETRGWREPDLAEAVDRAAQTEWLVKGGSRDPHYALERYVRFIARKGRGASS